MKEARREKMWERDWIAKRREHGAYIIQGITLSTVVVYNGSKLLTGAKSVICDCLVVHILI